MFGPRGVGKTAWLRERLPDALFFDLLDHRVATDLLADPRRLGDRVPAAHRGWVVLDEVQRVPAALDEVHRLIETRRLRFALTGSSARKLRRRGVNLLGGRAVTRFMHPLTARELGADFDLSHALRFGGLPLAWTSDDPGDYLGGYAGTYLREEVQQEGLARNVGAFGRFLEAVSFSQASVLNKATIARECAIAPKVVEDYLGILEDLLIAVRLPVFSRRAKRRIVAHPKFFLFDAGVHRAVRPRGPLDSDDLADGAALETLVLHHLRAQNDYGNLGYRIHYWRTPAGHEVDFVLYGERGLRAFEVQRSHVVRDEDLRALRLFQEDYPVAKLHLLHLGDLRRHDRGIDVLPAGEFLADPGRWL